MRSSFVQSCCLEVLELVAGGLLGHLIRLGLILVRELEPPFLEKQGASVRATQSLGLPFRLRFALGLDHPCFWRASAGVGWPVKLW